MGGLRLQSRNVVDGRSLRGGRMAASAAPATPTFVAYYRVSTDRQGRSGLGLEAQRETASAYIAGQVGGGEIVAEFTEVESGRRNERPQLALALEAAKRGRATLVIAKLDRLARNTRFLLSIVESGADVAFCDLPTIPPGPVGKFLITQMAAVAELEAGLISQRTKAALAVVKAKGKRLGNPRPERARELAAASNRATADRFAATAVPLIAQLKEQGHSLRGIARELNQRQIPSAHGTTWYAATVRAVLLRSGRSGRSGQRSA